MLYLAFLPLKVTSERRTGLNTAVTCFLKGEKTNPGLYRSGPKMTYRNILINMMLKYLLYMKKAIHEMDVCFVDSEYT